MTTVSATTARANLYDLIDEVSASGKRVGITKQGVAKAVLVSQEDWEAMLVTLETLSDPELMGQIRQGERDIKEGKYISLDQLEKDVSSHNLKTSRKRVQKTK